MEIKKIKSLYEIKENGVIRKVKKDEYVEYVSKIKEEKKESICKDCRVCNCRKITLQDINADEVVNATRRKQINVVIDSETNERIKLDSEDTRINVFDCKKFSPFREKALPHERKLIKEILNIDKQLFEYEFDSTESLKTQGIEVLELQKNRLILLNSITFDTLLDDLKYYEDKLFKKIYYQKITHSDHARHTPILNKKAEKTLSMMLEILNSEIEE